VRGRGGSGGGSAAWQARKNAACTDENVDARPERYRDWGLLRYWFRTVEQYAPWVRRIHLVTDGQCPEWIRRDNPKLNLVDHRHYIPADYLPTFSANPIELNFHRISGLSEQFVYFNDDMFLTRPAKETDFFAYGLPCDSAVLSPVVVAHPNDIGSIALNDMCVINAHFEKRRVIRRDFSKWFAPVYGSQLLRTLCLMPWRHLPGFVNHHMPQPFLKRTFEQVWQAEPTLLDEVCRHQVRCYQTDLNQWLMRYWQFCEGSFTPASPRRGRHIFPDQTENFDRGIVGGRYSFICLDDNSRIADFAATRQRAEDAFRVLAPKPSSFEKAE
jgi:hypothetical protein